MKTLDKLTFKEVDEAVSLYLDGDFMTADEFSDYVSELAFQEGGYTSHHYAAERGSVYIISQ